MADDVFDAWRADRAAGLDAIMLAPTRDLVAELNQRARAHRLNGLDVRDPAASGRPGGSPTATRPASATLIITRQNNRELRTRAHRLGQER